jgi:hypothetical protein
MSDAFGAASLVVMAALLGGVAASVLRGTAVGQLGPMAINFRGLPKPVSLGIVLAVSVVVTRLLVLFVIGVAGGELGLELVAQLIAVILAFGAGLYDDLSPRPERGVVRQVALLREGRLAPGVVKLVGLLLAGVAAVAVVGGEAGRMLIGIPLIAGTANLWNLLDVRPGRSIKFFLLAAVVVGAVGWPGQSMLLTAVTFGAAAAILPADLEEQGMLGDAGAAVLGMVIGIGLYNDLGVGALAAALAVVVVLHVVSETVTLSSIIRALPPLRWFDHLGRMQPVEPEIELEG